MHILTTVAQLMKTIALTKLSKAVPSVIKWWNTFESTKPSYLISGIGFRVMLLMALPSLSVMFLACLSGTSTASASLASATPEIPASAG